MKVNTLEESVVSDIGRAFGEYDYGGEHQKSHPVCNFSQYAKSGGQACAAVNFAVNFAYGSSVLRLFAGAFHFLKQLFAFVFAVNCHNIAKKAVFQIFVEAFSGKSPFGIKHSHHSFCKSLYARRRAREMAARALSVVRWNCEAISSSVLSSRYLASSSRRSRSESF